MLVSVIIPVRNEEKNIERLLRSIKAQVYKKIEIIIVDDQSSDSTVEVSKKFTRFVYKRGHCERSVQRNFGAKKSKGDYLLFLDADMELTRHVVGSCLKMAKKGALCITIAEKTVGGSLLSQVRNFEREMYMGDASIEVPRFFNRNVFFEFGGYDPALTGPEDFDLPYRIGKKYPISRVNNYILHHEEGVTLGKLLRKKYYYAANGATYATKHPELVSKQGNLFFRRAYFNNWRKFLQKPALGLLFVLVRMLETLSAIAGYVSAVGLIGFLRTLCKMFKIV